MSDPVEQNARAAAYRLAAEHGRGLPADVEAALHARGSVPRPDQYLDPVSLAGLIVSAASLAWTVYADLKTRTAKPAPEVVARTVRVRLESAGRAGRSAPSPAPPGQPSSEAPGGRCRSNSAAVPPAGSSNGSATAARGGAIAARRPAGCGPKPGSRSDGHGLCRTRRWNPVARNGFQRVRGIIP
jgi:hypothetical protein